MKTLSLIFYILGFVLLVVSCFTTGVALTWWMGGGAVAALVIACVIQFRSNSLPGYHSHA